ncbi:MAG: hypothetical protein BUE48_000905 [Thermomonospora sp. CIF 1]|nr:MAG: hypothetical protein BUE48_000905 [Thermomonospora sp. CIF 1]
MLTCAALATACGGQSGDGKAGADQESERAAPAGTGYTSDQLRQALPTELSGYRRTGEPEAGEYASLKSIANFLQLQRQVTYDKPRCAKVTGASVALDEELRTVPAAVAIFSKGGGHSVSTTLMAVPNSTAERHVQVRMPEQCKQFRTKINGKWAEHEVVEAGSGDTGLGSRIVGVASTLNETAVKTWYVVLRGRGYLATIALYGPTATRAEAEQLARQTYDHAERILP